MTTTLTPLPAVELTADEAAEDAAHQAAVQALRDQLIPEGEQLSKTRTSLTTQLGNVNKQFCQLVVDAGQGRWALADVERWAQHSRKLGAPYAAITPDLLTAIINFDVVPNEPLREAYETAIGEARVAREAECSGYRDEDELVADFLTELALLEANNGEDYDGERFTVWGRARLRWALGLEGRDRGDGRVKVEMFMPYHQAAALTRALGVDPHVTGV